MSLVDDMPPLAAVQDHCPTCGRWLATYHGDCFDLAGKAEVALRFDLSEARERGTTQGWAVPDTAVCLRWRCRLRRWLRSRASADSCERSVDVTGEAWIEQHRR